MAEGIVRKQSVIFPQTKTSLLESMLYCLEILYICKVAHQFTVGFYVLGFSFCLEKSNAEESRCNSARYRHRETYTRQFSWCAVFLCRELPAGGMVRLGVMQVKSGCKLQQNLPRSSRKMTFLRLFLIPPSGSQVDIFGRLGSHPEVHIALSLF